MRKPPPRRLGKVLLGVILDIVSVVAFVPFMLYVLRTMLAVQSFMYDFREHGLREIMRAHPTHRRDLILVILNNQVKHGGFVVRGFGAGRRYRLRFRHRRRWRLKEKLSEWWVVGGPTWAH